jgi:hypothetical protein
MVQKYPRNTQLDQRLDDAAARLRKGTPLERESFIRRPREAESAPHVIELANSPSIEPPE